MGPGFGKGFGDFFKGMFALIGCLSIVVVALVGVIIYLLV